MIIQPRNFDSVSGKAVDVADDAVRNGWLFKEYLEMVKHAWIVAHENNLSQAKYQVEKSSK
jgi:orotate phosphoribosyltransferase-like protein